MMQKDDPTPELYRGLRVDPTPYELVEPGSVTGLVTKALGWELSGWELSGWGKDGRLWHTEIAGEVISRDKLELLSSLEKEDVPRELLKSIHDEDEFWAIFSGSDETTPSPSTRFLQKRLELGI